MVNAPSLEVIQIYRWRPSLRVLPSGLWKSGIRFRAIPCFRWAGGGWAPSRLGRPGRPGIDPIRRQLERRSKAAIAAGAPGAPVHDAGKTLKVRRDGPPGLPLILRDASLGFRQGNRIQI